MNGHLWRIPTLFGVMAGSALLLFAAGVVRSAMTRRRRSISMRVGTGATLVILAISAAIAIRLTATQVAHSLGINLTQVEPGPLAYLVPVMFAAFAFALGNWVLNAAWTSRRALLFYLWLVGFTFANVINHCSPGWCTTIGFPFTWHSWSDATLTFADGNVITWMTAIGQVLGAVLNLLMFAAVASVLARVRVNGRSA